MGMGSIRYDTIRYDTMRQGYEQDNQDKEYTAYFIHASYVLYYTFNTNKTNGRGTMSRSCFLLRWYTYHRRDNTMRVESSLVQSSPTMGTDTVSTHSNTRQQDKTKNNSCINPTYVLREREREREE